MKYIFSIFIIINLFLMSCSESPLPEIPDKLVPEVEEVEEEEVVEPPIVDI